MNLFPDDANDTARLQAAGWTECWGGYWQSPDRQTVLSREEALLRLDREQAAEWED